MGDMNRRTDHIVEATEMVDTAELVKALRWCGENRVCFNDVDDHCPYRIPEGEGVQCIKNLNGDAASTIETLTARIKVLEGENRTLRNELCLKCGNYEMAHKGACDGCRWMDTP